MTTAIGEYMSSEEGVKQNSPFLSPIPLIECIFRHVHVRVHVHVQVFFREFSSHSSDALTP